MIEQINNYKKFFLDQAYEQQREYRKIRLASMQQLFREDKACYATVDHINSETGHVVLKFRKGYAPRLKMLRSFVLIKKAARVRWGDFPPTWDCCFDEFIKSKDYCTPYSDITPLYYLKKNDTRYDYVGCTSVSIEMFAKIKSALSEGILIHVIMYDSEPPTAYYFNLSHYLENYSDDKDLLIKPLIKYDDWHPEELSYDPNDGLSIAKTITKAVHDYHDVVLQGPPGTGKSFTIAHVISDYLNEGKSVCVTTMANKGLEELITQPPLEQHLRAGHLSKTLLTADEAVHAKGLKKASKNMIVPRGEALFSTNYKLSMLFSPDFDGSIPTFDLIVIEEASQAYLTTIVAFKKLGIDCLIVGDPMQLPPIVSNSQKSDYKVWNVDIQTDGLTSYALGTSCKSYRIVTTFRLTQASAKLTGIFYNDSLKSVRTEIIDFSDIDKNLFPVEGGVVYKVVSGATNGVSSKKAIKLIGNIIQSLSDSFPKSSVAIISPFKDTIKDLQSNFLTDKQKLNLTIETIDRVQGITVDYAILYFPLRNVGFALDARRFNVATSRSKSTTLIISDIELLNMNSLVGKVRTFISRAMRL